MPPSTSTCISGLIREFNLSLIGHNQSFLLHTYTRLVLLLLTMYRAALPVLRVLPSRTSTIAPILLRPQAQTLLRAPISLTWRGYAASSGLSKDDISNRVMDVMKTFEKVDGGKVGLFSDLLDLVMLFPYINCRS